MKAQPKLKKFIAEFIKLATKQQQLLLQLAKLDTTKHLQKIEEMTNALIAKSVTDAERDHWGDLLSAIHTDFKSKEGLLVAKSYAVAFDKATKKAMKAADAEVKAKKEAEAKAKKDAETAAKEAKEAAKLEAKLAKQKAKETSVKEVEASTAPVEVPVTAPTTTEAPPLALLDL